MKEFSYTSEGPRQTNQDHLGVVRLASGALLVCVADGVGGNNGGEVASQFAVETFVKLVVEKQATLTKALEHTHSALLKLAAKDTTLKGMATTLTAVIISDTYLEGVHVGDSRAYLLRKNGLKQLSEDHSEVAKFLREGRLTKEQAIFYPRKNIIYSALGSQKALVIDNFKFDLQKKDRLVLTTDGFYNSVYKKQFRDLSKKFNDINDFGSSLVNYVNIVGASDNFTVVIVEVDD